VIYKAVTLLKQLESTLENLNDSSTVCFAIRQRLANGCGTAAKLILYTAIRSCPDGCAVLL
jgi:hypothetical protein